MNNTASLLAEIETAVGSGGVLTGAEVSNRSTGIWGGGDALDALAVVRPADTAAVAAVLAACSRQGQPVVTHGGLTGVVGGARSGAGD